MVSQLRDEILFGKVKVFHFIAADYVEGGIVIDDKCIIPLVKKIFGVLGDARL